MSVTVLLTNATKVKRTTSLNGNIDSDKLEQWIKVAQDEQVQNTLGTPLYEKLLDDVSAGSVTGNYQTLLDEYIVPMLCFYSAMYYVNISTFEVANGGIQVRRGEDSDSATLGEVKYLAQKYRDIAERYQGRAVDWLCNNNSLVPEYNQATGSDVYPDNSSNDFHGLVL